MAHGFFGGMIAGAVVSGLAVGSASVITDMPESDARNTAMSGVSTEAVVEQPLDENPVEATEQPSPDENDALAAIEPSVSETVAEPEPKSESVSQPGEEPAEASEEPVETAETTVETASVEVEPSSAATIDVTQVAPAAPDDLGAMQGADTLPAEQPETGTAGGELSSPDSQDGTDDVAVGAEQPIKITVQSEAPEAPGGEADLSISTDPAQPPQPEPEVEDSGFSTPEEPGEDQEDSRIAAVAGQDEAGVSGTIDNQADEVTTDRLPSVGDEPETIEPEAADPEPAPEVVEEAPGPLVQFAMEFENPDNKPLMSIILIDDGSYAIDADALKKFPFPVSFAVDVEWSDAAEAARRYHDAGFEVMAAVNLPENAAGRDTEVAMQAYLSNVPQAVAVMEGAGTGLQGNREASEQLVPILQQSGHGLVMFPSGLNTAQKIIAREGVPAMTAFRDFDSKGQGSKVIRRFLDHAAFKAGQNDDGVIMVGRVRDETLNALLLWGLQGRADSVAMAPISAVLQK